MRELPRAERDSQVVFGQPVVEQRAAVAFHAARQVDGDRLLVAVSEPGKQLDPLAGKRAVEAAAEQAIDEHFAVSVRGWVEHLAAIA